MKTPYHRLRKDSLPPSLIGEHMNIIILTCNTDEMLVSCDTSNRACYAVLPH